MLINKVKQTIKKYSLLNPGDRVVVAVSGGPDSVCLLAALQTLSKELDLALHIAHLDHMFRGKESAGEALFVTNLAKSRGLPATVEKIDVPAFCRQRGLSAQAGAREVRYDFLARVAGEANAARIATGHTATDQAETFLLRLIRGAGVSGLSGIPPARGRIVRPLIEVTREEILEYLKKNRSEYVSDSSNMKPIYTRNRIRIDLLPVLNRFNPRIIDTLASEAAVLRDEDEAADASLRAVAAEVLLQEAEAVIIKREPFQSLLPAFKRRLLRKAWNASGMELPALSSVQIDEALAFLNTASTGRSIQLPYGLTIEREYDNFILRHPAAVPAYSRDLAVPGGTLIAEAGVSVKTAIHERRDESGAGVRPLDGPFEENYFWQAQFDYDKIGPSLRIRNRLPGDWFCPSGMSGKSKKLQDYFVDEKVPRRRRGIVPLIVAGEDIVWVVGFRTDERFLIHGDTKRVIEITVRAA